MNKILLPTLFWFLVSAFTTLEAEDKVPYRSLELKTSIGSCMVTDFNERAADDSFKKEGKTSGTECNVTIKQSEFYNVFEFCALASISTYANTGSLCGFYPDDQNGNVSFYAEAYEKWKMPHCIFICKIK